MNWNSPAEFFAMGGYGFYVWGSFAVTAGCLVIESLMLRHRRCTALAELKRKLILKKEESDEKSS